VHRSSSGGQPGRQFVLRAENLGSLGIGSPIYYRRLQPGRSSPTLGGRWKADRDYDFFNAPYDKYVNPAHVFWNASGVDASVGAGGVEVRTQS